MDASVVLKVVLPESDSAIAISRLTSGQAFEAPEILVWEGRSAISKAAGIHGYSISDALRIVADFESFIATYIRLAPLAGRMAEKAVELSVGARHAFYDCTYVALAEGLNVALLTADARQARVAQLRLPPALVQSL